MKRKEEERWRRGRVALAMGLLAGVLFAASARALLWTDAGRAENPFAPGEVSIALQEPSFVPGSPAPPGKSVPKDPCVRNTGSRSLLVFLTVEVPRRTLALVQGDEAASPAAVDLFRFTADSHWQMVGEAVVTQEKSRYVYGYDKVLAPGESTTPLFRELKTVSYLEGSFSDGEQVYVDLLAEAIQSEADQGSPEATYALLRSSE